ncbi:MAG: hypothetical protein LBS88_09705 [Tannerellaceae bacterium]|jgi:hypothetical protein|nr:hypothetical protein [Tannerellaceae bacterium]
MKTLKVIISKTSKGVFAHLPQVERYVIARDSVVKLKKDLRKSLRFHIDGLYEEEREEWMDEVYDFEYAFHDIPSLIEAYSEFINESNLARISGIEETLMHQYVSGAKRPARKTLERIENGLREYANELRSISFDYE